MHRLFLVGLAVLLSGVGSWMAADQAGIPLWQLAAYFDGHLYIEIAKSFPVPYGPAATLYAGHAPGYPAFIYLLGLVLSSWGISALAISWVAAGVSAAVFWSLCVELGLRPFWPTLTFVVAHPYWRVVCSSAQAEPVAVALILMSIVACIRGQPIRAIAVFCLACLTRFPAIAIAPAIAARFATTGKRRASALALVIPGATLLAWDRFIAVRVPGSGGVTGAHRTWLELVVEPPFTAFLRENPVTLPFSYVVASVSILILILSLRLVRQHGWLVVWFASTVLFHAMLSGANPVWRIVALADFPRFTLLAWPSAVLVFALSMSTRATAIRYRAIVIVLGVFSQAYLTAKLDTVILLQPAMNPSLKTEIQRLENRSPTWSVSR